MADNSFYDDFLKPLFGFGSTVTILYTTAYLIEKNKKYRSEIKELFSRLEKYEKNHESSHELKK